jgi:hypothetical protein
MSLTELEEARELLKLHIQGHEQALRTWSTETSQFKHQVGESRSAQRSVEDEIGWTSREVEAVTYELGGEAGVPSMDVGKEIELEAAKRQIMDLYRLRDRVEDNDGNIDKALRQIDAQIKEKTISFSESFAHGDFDAEIIGLMSKLAQAENDKSACSQQRVRCEREISRLEAKLLTGHKAVALLAQDEDANRRRFQLRKMLSDWEMRTLLNGEDDAIEQNAGVFQVCSVRSVIYRVHDWSGKIRCI